MSSKNHETNYYEYDLELAITSCLLHVSHPKRSEPSYGAKVMPLPFLPMYQPMHKRLPADESIDKFCTLDI